MKFPYGTIALILFSQLIFIRFAFADEWTWRDFKTEATSPFNEAAKPFTYWGGAAATAAIIFEDEIGDPVEEESHEDHPLGNFSVIGDVAGRLVPNIIYAGGMALRSRKYDDPVAERHAITMTKATAYSVTLTTIIKYTVRERRPQGDNRDSFPSGHTTSVSAFASVVVCEHGWGAAGIGATALAAFSGYSRINDNQHYLHDVIAGAVIGTAYGVGISSLNKSDTLKNYSNDNSSIFVPLVAGDAYGLSWFKPF